MLGEEVTNPDELVPTCGGIPRVRGDAPVPSQFGQYPPGHYPIHARNHEQTLNVLSVGLYAMLDIVLDTRDLRLSKVQVLKAPHAASTADSP